MFSSSYRDQWWGGLLSRGEEPMATIEVTTVCDIDLPSARQHSVGWPTRSISVSTACGRWLTDLPCAQVRPSVSGKESRRSVGWGRETTCGLVLCS